MDATLRGSMMASSGFMQRRRMPVLHCFSGMSMMDTPVVSLPVPAVVGTSKFALVFEEQERQWPLILIKLKIEFMDSILIKYGIMD
jgi:hypothetical protein